MLGNITFVIGTCFVVIGLFWIRGPAMTVSDYIYSILVILFGIFVVWVGNKKLFKKDFEKKDVN